jgi:putative transposase
MRRFCTSLVAFAACTFVVSCEQTKPGEPAPYLLVFAGDADGADSDFLAVIDIRSDSPDFGKAIATMSTGMKSSMPYGTEFVSAAMDLWAYTNGVILDFSRRGKPTDNAAIESFNGRFREECLNVHWFASLEDAQRKIDAFRWDYNEHHPHRALKGLSPREFAKRMLHRAADSLSQ